jgi:uncharacterized protein with NAD-binding domain and iron-sulfur cluster
MAKVVIFGAGISGLTLAHELINKGFQVEIYEKDSIVGGMARSIRTKDNNIPTEHSWRGYAPFYNNTYQIQKQIPIEKNCDSDDNFKNTSDNKYTLNEIKKHNKRTDLWTYYKGGVYDITKFISKHPGGNIITHAGGKDLEEVWKEHNVNWHNNNNHIIKLLEQYKIGTIIETFNDNNPNPNPNPNVFDNVKNTNINFNLLQNSLTLPYKNKIINNIDGKDMPYLYYKFLQFQMYGSKRNELSYKKRLIDEIKNNISERSYKYLIDYISGPGFGLDKNSMSIGHYIIFLSFNNQSGLSFNNQSGNKSWKVMNQPTSEGWFNPWVKYLESKGVIFHYNKTLQKIYNNNDNNNDNTNNNDNNTKITKCIVNNQEIVADEYIIAINPFEYQKVLENSKLSLKTLTLKKEIENYRNLNTINNQIGFVIGFNKKFNYKNKNDCFVLLDSPNNITFYPQDSHWCKSIDLGTNVKSLWSGTCIISYNKGSLYGKSLTLLKIEELKKEIIHQFMESNDLMWYISEYNDGHIINGKDIEVVEIFSDWKYDNRLYSVNKKFVNNIYNEEYRPNNITDFQNLYIAGSHTKTSINIWSMEGAVESGKIVSNIILDKYNKPNTYIYKHNLNSKYKLFNLLDDILYKFNLPNILDTLIFIILIIILIITYKITYKITYNYLANKK